MLIYVNFDIDPWYTMKTMTFWSSLLIEQYNKSHGKGSGKSNGKSNVVEESFNPTSSNTSSILDMYLKEENNILFSLEVN